MDESRRVGPVPPREHRTPNTEALSAGKTEGLEIGSKQIRKVETEQEVSGGFELQFPSE